MGFMQHGHFAILHSSRCMRRYVGTPCEVVEYNGNKNATRVLLKTQKYHTLRMDNQSPNQNIAVIFCSTQCYSL